MVVEHDYFKQRDVVAGGVAGCEWIAFLVLTIEFTNKTREVDVEEVNNDLCILAPVQSKDYDLILNLKLVVVDDHNFNVAHIIGGREKLVCPRYKRNCLCPIQMVALYNYIYHFLHNHLIVLGKVLKADLSKVLVDVVDPNKVDQAPLVGGVVKVLADVF